jgi:hypothetical protein
VRQVPAVRNLERTWRTTSGRTGIDPIAVTTDDLCAGVLIEPLHQRLSGRVLQQVHDAMGSGIHQDRAVPAPTAKRELIDTEHARRLDTRLGQCAHQAQQRRSAGRHRQPRAVATPWAATERKADAFEHRPEPTRAMGVALRHGGHLLDERPARAVGLLAAKPAYPQLDQYPATRDRQIGQVTFILAVERC